MFVVKNCIVYQLYLHEFSAALH